jgi:hypothetical protein
VREGEGEGDSPDHHRGKYRQEGDAVAAAQVIAEVWNAVALAA